MHHLKSVPYCVAMLLFFGTSACKQAGPIQFNTSSSQKEETEKDSATIKFVDAFIGEFLKENSTTYFGRIRDGKKENKNRVRQQLLYEYNLDNQLLSKDSFTTFLANQHIGHVTKGIRMASQDSMQGQRSKRLGNDIIFSLSAYSTSFINERIFEIEHIDLHYSEFEVLYLSLSTQRTGKMRTQLYVVETGEEITSYQANGFDGTYYIGNGISQDVINCIEELDDTERIRAVIMIDDQFCIKDFNAKEIFK